VTVEHVAEGATKPDSTGTVAQKISTVHKVAGVSSLSDELLEDSNGNAAEIVSRQFGQSIGIEIDKAILSGSGTGEPTGILNPAAGVDSNPVDGQGGEDLLDSIFRARSRLAQRFFDVDTVVVAVRDGVKWDLAKDANGVYLFSGGLRDVLGAGVVVVDANVPVDLGAGDNESVIIVGNFRAGCHFYSRHGLRVDSSQAPGFVEDLTTFRGVERYGFAVVQPDALEILTGVLP
jgi:HK97 family phage major capsid protein